MRTETTTRTLYQFAELSEHAKEKARDWYRQGIGEDSFWSECVVEDFQTIAKFLGFDIGGPNPNNRHDMGLYWSIGGHQGDGASFQGQWYQSAMELDELKAHASADKELHRIGDALASIPIGLDGDLDGRPAATFRVRGNYSGMSCDCDNVDRDGEDTIKEAARDLCTWLRRALEREWEYQYSAECVDESIVANEYEFTIYGERA